MGKTVWFATAIIAATGILLAADKGLRPRPAASDYPGRSEAPGPGRPLQIGAELLGSDQVRNTFATDLNRGFLVVEVGFFPTNSWDVKFTDFSLRVGADKFIRPVTPSTIASILQSKMLGRHKQRGGSGGGTNGPGDLVLYPSATIGYESAGGIDPTGRRRTNGGWVTGGGVGVGMGGNGGGGNNPQPQAPPPPGASDADRRVMATELEDKALPEGETAQPVSGYLYFPLPEDRKGGGPDPKKAYELTYQGGATKVRFPLPLPPK